ncbi:hypothetical protein ACFYY1_29945 [Streptomyces sp. NPDC001890]|uniref:hypothetical protein n=1 Tax=Streptomyces sp. NPDC001890 TaxID=3364620 RepID=UPI0036BD7C21
MALGGNLGVATDESGVGGNISSHRSVLPSGSPGSKAPSLRTKASPAVSDPACRRASRPATSSPVTYRISALLQQFDVACAPRACQCSSLTGALSAFLGEGILLDALAHALQRESRTVQQLPGTPHRDNTAFAPAHASSEERKNALKNIPRDLDAWLLLDSNELVAVECKMRTASSMDGRSTGTDAAADGRREWQRLMNEHFTKAVWTDTNKVALPLTPPQPRPAGLSETKATNPTRILAYWRPVTRQGHWFSDLTTTSHDTTLPVDVRVFSASLYLRALLAEGTNTLPSSFDHTKARLEQLRLIVAL